MCENWGGGILSHILCTCVTNNPFFSCLALRKLKMIFLNIKVGNFLWHNCLTWEDAPIYKIWAHYLKKWHRYGLALGHLDWKPWMFIHDRPCCEASFSKSCQNSSLSFFMASSTHTRRACERIHFFNFCYFLWLFSK